MSDDYKRNESDEINDFFSQFDKISDDFTKNFPENKSRSSSFAEKVRNAENELYESNPSTQRKTRSQRLAEKKKGKRININIPKKISNFASKFLQDEAITDDNKEQNGYNTGMRNNSKRRNKKYKINKKQLLKFCLGVFIALCLVLGAYCAVVVATAPKISPDNVYTLLSESSVIYDDKGKLVDTVSSGEIRDNIEYSELPEELICAFISIEDKTFETHNGFNIIRIFGAIKDSIIYREPIGGTSTITQQLARNVYLKEEATTRSLKRKIAEAYYTVLIEKALTKDQIMEAYLNTIYLGYNSYGVQMAAQSYFSKDVNELDLIECAAIASLPKAPHSYALVKKLDPSDVDPDSDIILYTGSDYTYIYNGDKSENRRIQTLKNMYEYGYITEDEMNSALEENLLEHMKINANSINQISSYYTDYVVAEIIADLVEENGMDKQEATELVYSGGLQIYTTMDSNAQKIAEKEFSNNANFPSVANITKDRNGNILGKNGSTLLYSYNNYFDSKGTFTLNKGEFKWLSDGSLQLNKGNKLNFYKVQGSSGKETVQIEFKNLYVVENGTFYSIAGGAILLPEGYTSKDSDGNAIIDADFFDDEEFESGPQQFFKKSSNGTLCVDNNHYTLQQKVVQPQSAMVITDHSNGQIKAMVGGRNIIGEKLFNRATSARQPGSSIKPITVYGAALQQSVELLADDKTPHFSSEGIGYGTYFTAASMINDSPLIIDGKQWPKNWYNGYRGLQSFRYSVEHSINVNAVKVLQEIGTSYSVEYAKKLGISSIVEEGSINDVNASALALGGMTKGISPLELAIAYGVYPNGGKYIEPIAYTKVTNPRGKVILEKESKSETVIDAGVAFIMTDILRTTVSNGIAGSAAIGVQPVGGKTGTTTDNYDAWFVGFTPQYSAALWIGNDVNIELSTGSAAAAKLWSNIMKQVCSNFSHKGFRSAPDNITSLSTDLGTTEYFIKGTRPPSLNGILKATKICGDSGMLATPLCTTTTTKISSASESDSDNESGIPKYYCHIHNPDTTQYPISTANGDGSTVLDSEGNPIQDIPDDDPNWIPVVETQTE